MKRRQFKTLFQAGALALGVLTLSGCGLLGMGGKVDDTNQKIDRTNNSVDRTNEIIRKMTDLMARMNDSTSQMNSKMDETNSRMDETNSKLDKSNQAIHKQVLQTSLTDMQTPEHTQYVSFTSPSPPTGMMPGGKIFAEEATSDELIALTYVLLKDIDEVKPDEGHARDAGVAQAMDHDKLVKLTTLQVIAGFAPQVTIEQAVQNQVIAGGRYSNTVYSVLMLRAMFLDSILVESDLFAHKLDNLGKLHEAYNRIAEVDWIARLPFRDQIGLKVVGMIDPSHKMDLKLDHRMTVSRWDRLASRLQTELDPATVSAPEAQAQVAELKGKIAERQEYWKQNP